MNQPFSESHRLRRDKHFTRSPYLYGTIFICREYLDRGLPMTLQRMEDRVLPFWQIDLNFYFRGKS